MKRVYVMDCGDFIKIGVSGNPDKRKNHRQISRNGRYDKNTTSNWK